MKKFKKIAAYLLVMFLLTSTFININVTVADASEVTVLKRLPTGAKTEYAPGESITFLIDYAYKSNTNIGQGIVIVDQLPSSMEFVSASGTNHIASISDDNSSNTVTFTFINDLPAGVTGTLSLVARFIDGEVVDETVARNTATISGTSLDPSISSTDVTSTTHENDWSIEKSKTLPSGNPIPGSEVNYRITVKGNSSGGLNLENVILVDTLPDNITVVNDGGGTLDGNTITWNIGDLKVGQSISKDITLIYDPDFWSVNDKPINYVSANGNDISSPTALPEINALKEVTLSLPEPSLAFNKTGRENDDEFSFDQLARFTFNSISNTGNVELENFYIIDEIPIEFWLDKVTSGSYTNIGDTFPVISYKTNLNTTWRIFGSNTENTNATYKVADLNLGAGEFINVVKWDFGTVPVGFAIDQNIYVYGYIHEIDKNDVEVVVSDTEAEVTNTATLYGTFNKVEYHDSSTSVFDVTHPIPRLDPDKSIVGDSHVKPDGTIEFKLEVKNHSFATGDLSNPIAIDVLPFEVVYIDGVNTWSWDPDKTDFSSTTHAPTFEIIDRIIDGEMRQVLIWDFNHVDFILKPNQKVFITFSVTAKTIEIATVGTYTNEFYMTTNTDLEISDRTQNIELDVIDLDDDGVFTDLLSKDSQNFYIDFKGLLESDKWIKGELDSVWANYNSDNNGIGSTLPGGIVDYRLEVRNPNSNGPIKNIVMIDILPEIDDTGVLIDIARESSWVPYLVDEIVVTDKDGQVIAADVYYSTRNYSTDDAYSIDIIEDELKVSGSAGAGWSTTPPSDITTVKSLKIDLGDFILNPGEFVRAQWPMRAPLNAPAASLTWNSFAYSARYPYYAESGLTYESFLPSEPVKVGYIIEANPDSVYTLGDYVFEDFNANGIQDSGDTGINGVLVNLYNEGQDISVDAPIAFTRTGKDFNGLDGYYGFPNLALGNYIVEFIYNDIYIVPAEKEGTDESKDSNGVLSSIEETYVESDENKINTGSINLTDNNYDIDLGLFKTASVGNRIFYDENGNGIQDNDELGIEGVDLLLSDEQGNPIDVISTDANGNYLFEGLYPGSYIISVTNPDSEVYLLSAANRGSNDEKDSDFDINTGQSPIITLISGENNLSIDGGYYKPATLGNYIFLDSNTDGIQDSGELGLAGVTVVLLDENDNAVYNRSDEVVQATTGTDGKYLFTELAPGEYKISISNPGGYAYSPKDQGLNDALDSDIDEATGKSDVVELDPGEEDLTLDGGLYPLATIGNFVWYDINENGIQDESEIGVSGVTVLLIDVTGATVDTEITDSNGYYLFEDVNPGTYTVKFNDEEHFYFTTKTAGSDVAVDSNVNPTSFLTDSITVESGEHNISIDAGIILEKAMLGNYVWYDANQNGIQDEYENGVENVKVTLLDTNSNELSSTITNEDGLYQFVNLVPGNYKIQVELPIGYMYTEINLGDDATDSDVDITTNNQSPFVTLAPAEYNGTLDVGLVVLNSLGDRVFLDTNKNGKQDVNEKGIENIIVKLYNDSDELLYTTSTNEEGYYLFSNLLPGTYYIEVDRSSGYNYTKQDEILDDSLDSDVNIYGISHSVTLVTNDHDLSVDAGMIKTYVIETKLGMVGDTIFIDENKNGILDINEKGIGGVKVYLLNLYDEVIKETVTDNNGKYLFNDLVTSAYSVRIDIPENYILTEEGAGEDRALDSNFDIITNTSERFTIILGGINLSIDGGLISTLVVVDPPIPPVIIPTPDVISIGNYIWMDDNVNGIQDEGEAGVSGITLQLVDAISNNIIKETMTNTNGYYTFDNVVSLKEYYIIVKTPENLAITYVNKGTDDMMDSDAYYNDEDYVTETIAVSKTDNSFDIGLVDLELIPDWEVPRAPFENPQTSANINYTLYLLFGMSLLFVIGGLFKRKKKEN